MSQRRGPKIRFSDDAHRALREQVARSRLKNKKGERQRVVVENVVDS